MNSGQLSIITDFPALPDYSSALQRDILVHGRLYLSQHFLCFYSNIFGWETNLTIKLKDVTAVTKEKTALVIPNAILVTTETDKHFFTSFTARDNAYLMLFRVWQNALMDKAMEPTEMWQWVHYIYGDELGLDSEDEDYIDPFDDDQPRGKPTKSLMYMKLNAMAYSATDSVSVSAVFAGVFETLVSVSARIDKQPIVVP